MQCRRVRLWNRVHYTFHSIHRVFSRLRKRQRPQDADGICFHYPYTAPHCSMWKKKSALCLLTKFQFVDFVRSRVGIGAKVELAGYFTFRCRRLECTRFSRDLRCCCLSSRLSLFSVFVYRFCFLPKLRDDACNKHSATPYIRNHIQM